MIEAQKLIQRGDLAKKIGEKFKDAEDLQQRAWAILDPIIRVILDIESLGEASLYLDKLANVQYGDDLDSILEGLGKARGIKKKPGVIPDDVMINDSDRNQILKLAKILAGKYEEKDKEFATLDLEAQKALSEHVKAVIATAQEVIKDFDQSHGKTLEAEKVARVKREEVIVADKKWLTSNRENAGTVEKTAEEQSKEVEQLLPQTRKSGSLRKRKHG